MYLLYLLPINIISVLRPRDNSLKRNKSNTHYIYSVKTTAVKASRNRFVVHGAGFYHNKPPKCNLEFLRLPNYSLRNTYALQAFM